MGLIQQPRFPGNGYICPREHNLKFIPYADTCGELLDNAARVKIEVMPRKEMVTFSPDSKSPFYIYIRRAFLFFYLSRKGVDVSLILFFLFLPGFILFLPLFLPLRSSFFAGCCIFFPRL